MSCHLRLERASQRVLYDLLKYFAENAHFHDRTAEKVKGMMTRLKIETLAGVSIPEVADFIEGTGDPYFARDMQRIVMESYKEALAKSA